MNKYFSTDLRHLLDENGVIPNKIPEAVKNMVNGLGNVIVSVTGESRKSAKCWAPLQKNPCNGEIDAVIDPKTSDILWLCSKCGDQGSISHWENTFWDCRSC